MQEIWQAINDVKRVNIYTHKGPDGDSIGSCVGLHYMIQEHLPDVDSQVIMQDPVYQKLCDFYADVLQMTPRKADLHIYPDSPRKDVAADLFSPSIAIDHHATREPFADGEYVRVWPSCCGLLFREFESLGLSVSKKAAQAFLIGAITDTGFGQYGTLSDRQKALRDMSDLDAICDSYNRAFLSQIYGLTNDQQQWLLSMVNKATIDNDIFSLYIPGEEIQGWNLSNLRACTQEFTHTVAAKHYIWGYKLGDDEKFSVRSQAADMTAFAAKYGGGGHKGASSFRTSDDPSSVIQAFRQFILHQ